MECTGTRSRVIDGDVVLEICSCGGDTGRSGLDWDRGMRDGAEVDVHGICVSGMEAEGRMRGGAPSRGEQEEGEERHGICGCGGAAGEDSKAKIPTKMVTNHLLAVAGRKHAFKVSMWGGIVPYSDHSM